MKKYRIFLSYSHNDEKYKIELEKHLSTLRRNGIINDWSDRKIIPGQEWDKEIKNELENADIILLLISPDFLASNYCHDIEVQRAIEMNYNNEAVTIPIILEYCDWKETHISKLQGLPKDAKPVSGFDNTNKAFFDIVSGIKKAIQYEKQKKEVISSYSKKIETTRNKLAKFSYDKLEKTTGLEDFVEFLKDSKYHPKSLIPTISISCSFLGHGASKWTREVDLLDKAIRKAMVNGGWIRFMIFDPRFTELQYEKEKILKSILVLKGLQQKYNRRNQDFMKVRLYKELPSFRLAFINQQVVVVGHYKTYTANSNDSPNLVFNSSEEWSFYSAFKALYNEKWENASKLDDIWEELKPIYNEKGITIKYPEI